MKDIHSQVTNKIIEALQTNQGDWLKPFRSLSSGLPVNASTGNTYKGINTLLLSLSGTSRYWASYKQWQALGAQVRKGSKGTMIVFYKILTRENKDGTEKSFPLIRYSSVFSSDQVDGWTAPVLDEAPLSTVEALANVDTWISNTDATIKFNSAGKCFYTPSEDYISMARRESFTDTETSDSTELYYSTLLHELTHWTGCKKRLDRTTGKRFADYDYAYEELVAELGAAMQCAMLNISSEPRADHVQYIQGWLKALKNDNKLIFSAAAQAQKAVDFIDQLQGSESA
jgi:antirestriction protein ArdC